MSRSPLCLTRELQDIIFYNSRCCKLQLCQASDPMWSVCREWGVECSPFLSLGDMLWPLSGWPDLFSQGPAGWFGGLAVHFQVLKTTVSFSDQA